MPHREVFRLKWARLAYSNPWPKSRATGAKREGLKYEKEVGKALPQARANVWVEFCDDNGPGFCCPDYVLKVNGALVIIECKLTDCADAYTQLSHLYLPVFEMLTGAKPHGIVVCRNLSRRSALPVHSIREALESDVKRPLHWMGWGDLIGWEFPTYSSLITLKSPPFQGSH
jgi:hypothetical protein